LPGQLPERIKIHQEGYAISKFLRVYTLRSHSKEEQNGRMEAGMRRERECMEDVIDGGGGK
jgi:predicted GIY-YIG superfamily endonuclease